MLGNQHIPEVLLTDTLRTNHKASQFSHIVLILGFRCILERIAYQLDDRSTAISSYLVG